MISRLKRFFNKSDAESAGESNEDRVHRLNVATSALFLEMARIDDEFTAEERETVLGILKEKYGLSEEEAAALVAEADRELDESADLWQFARRINENYSVEEKVEIIETLWQMVFVDGHMDSHEHYLMNKLKNLLRLSHKQLIDAKLKAKRA